MLICKSDSELRVKIESTNSYCAHTRNSIIKSLVPDMIYYYAVNNHLNGVCVCTPVEICSAFGVSGARSRTWINQVLNDCVNGQYDGFYYTVSNPRNTLRKKRFGCLPSYEVKLIGFSHPRM